MLSQLGSEKSLSTLAGKTEEYSGESKNTGDYVVTYQVKTNEKTWVCTVELHSLNWLLQRFALTLL